MPLDNIVGINPFHRLITYTPIVSFIVKIKEIARSFFYKSFYGKQQIFYH